MKKLLLSIVVIFMFSSSALAISEITKEMNSPDVSYIKDLIVGIWGPRPGVRIHKSDEYSVVFEAPTGNDVANFLFMNLRTGVQPVFRVYYQFIPMSDRTLVKCNTAFVENPNMPNEIVNMNIGNRNDEIILKNILENVASTVDPNYTPQYIDIKSKGNKEPEKIPEKKLGLVFDENGKVTDVKSDGAANGKILVDDMILELNGRSFSEMGNKKAEEYIKSKWDAGSSILMLVEHEGEKKIISIKKESEERS